MEDAHRRFIRISLHRMCDHYAPKLDAALRSLSTEDVWLKESGHANSIGGIALHIGEHVQRHIDRYSYLGPIAAGGIENHFPDEGIDVTELRSRTAKTFGSPSLQGLGQGRYESCLHGRASPHLLDGNMA